MILRFSPVWVSDRPRRPKMASRRPKTTPRRLRGASRQAKTTPRPPTGPNLAHAGKCRKTNGKSMIWGVPGGSRRRFGASWRPLGATWRAREARTWPREAGKEAGLAEKLISEAGKCTSEAAKWTSWLETYMFPWFCRGLGPKAYMFSHVV